MNDLGFYGLLKYLDVSIKNPIEYLNFILNHPEYHNDQVLDLIDYEKLITIEMQNQNNEEIQMLCKKIKNIIATKYMNKRKILARLEGRPIN